MTKALPGALCRRPDAVAHVRGSHEYPEIAGTVRFFSAKSGVIVHAEVSGLPRGDGIFAFHIHSGSRCSGNAEDPFADALTHYNPADRPHPYHAGDMPPLFSCGGRAAMAFLTGRFTLEEVLGRTVVIHDQPDDFSTQPAGNSGRKIACGQIVPVPSKSCRAL